MKLIVSTVSKVFIRVAIIFAMVALVLMGIGCALATWPFMKRNANTRKMLVTGEAISAVATAAMVFLKTPDA